MRKGLKRWFFVPLLFILLFGIYVYREFTRGVSSIVNKKPDFELSALQLIDQFENDSLASAKYSGKLVGVNGNIKSVEMTANSMMLFLGNASQTSSVRCFLDSMNSVRYQALQPNSTISLKGICAGYIEDPLLGSDIILNRCIVTQIQ